jgi:hypothetical protein
LQGTRPCKIPVTVTGIQQVKCFSSVKLFPGYHSSSYFSCLKNIVYWKMPPVFPVYTDCINIIGHKTKMIRHIIWDFDGTLFNTYPAIVYSFKTVLKSDFGVQYSPEEIR